MCKLLELSLLLRNVSLYCLYMVSISGTGSLTILLFVVESKVGYVGCPS